MKAQVMRRAWEIARDGQKTFGGKVSAYFATALKFAWVEAKSQKTESKEAMIKRLETLGFRRWTKYGKDRMYIDPEYLGFECDTYKTGNISWAAFKGERISNNHAKDYRYAKTYLDLDSMKMHSDRDDLREAAEELAKIA